MKNKKLVLLIILILVLAIIIFLVAFFFLRNSNSDGNTCMNLGCDRNTQFVGSKNSDKYYVCDCRFASLINRENIVCFSSNSDAISQNYSKVEC